jgi:hypothetical protein
VSDRPHALVRTIITRLRRLEDSLRSKVDDKGRTLADILRDRRRKRLAEDGLPPEQEEEGLFDPGNPPQTISDILRSRYRPRASKDGR